MIQFKVIFFAHIIHLMKALFCLTVAILFTLATGHLVASPTGVLWFSLDGLPMPTGNPVESNGLIRKFNAPVLRVTRSSINKTEGTILLLPGGAYQLLDMVNEGSLTAENLNRFGYDVVALEYHIDSGEKTRDLALQDAVLAWRLIKTRPTALGVSGGRFGIMGYSAGAHLAARTLQTLASNSSDPQPDDLILIYPAYLDESAPGVTEPQIRPPAHPVPRLIVMIAEDDKPAWVKSSAQYVDLWRKSGGQASYHPFKTGGHGFGMQPGLTGDLERWPEILNYLLENGSKPGAGPFNSQWSGFAAHRADRVAHFQKHQGDERGGIVFLGDSITEQWNLSGSFPGLKVANRGIAGDTTRGMFCRLGDNVLNLEPKAIVLLGGINDLFHSPKGTPDVIAANVRSILEQIRAASPDTPVWVCEILPSKDINDGSIRAANVAVDKVTAEFTNAHRVKTHDGFLDSEGVQNGALFTDGTHLTPAGYSVWERIMMVALAGRLDATPE